MIKNIFNLKSNFSPTGDQPRAIKELTEGLKENKKSQTLLGVTGSGKTFTMANVINNMNRPTLIMAPNKILAAQLYSEMKDFFPENHVEYFVSYYDYYQPEAYKPTTDTYIDKDASINEQLDRMRHSATMSMLTYRDVIVVSSVSSIYGMGDPVQYNDMKITFSINDEINLKETIIKLVNIQYSRNDVDFNRGEFRTRGDSLDIFPPYSQNYAYRLSFFDNKIESISEFDTLTGLSIKKISSISLFPNTHYATPIDIIRKSIKQIRIDLNERLKYFQSNMKYIEEQRLKERVNFDIEMMETTGTCRGIENYSRYLSGREVGEPPATLFEYLPKDSILFIDESHVTIPQIAAMSRGDRARKETLSQYGFRLPSCIDNRPLTFEEWDNIRPQTIFVSATPSTFELEQSNGIISEQLIRPTGLLDPECEIRPIENQVDNILFEIKKTKGSVLITTLTKKLAEQLTEYLNENNVKAKYLHSDIETLERIELINSLRKGDFNVLVGINLLREGLDIPECELVAIMDADKEGFLRSTRSLIQTIGRAARNANGRVILYTDKITDSIKNAMDETYRRRNIQKEYNKKNGIIPKTIEKTIKNIDYQTKDSTKKFLYTEKGILDSKDIHKEIKLLKSKMKKFAENLEFEKAAQLRDTINKLEENLLTLE